MCINLFHIERYVLINTSQFVTVILPSVPQAFNFICCYYYYYYYY
jgi:hypothetical protein